MLRSIKELEDYFQSVNLSMVDEHDYESNDSKYHEFKEELGMRSIHIMP